MKQAVRSKRMSERLERMSERFERTSKRTSKWRSTLRVDFLVNPKCVAISSSSAIVNRRPFRPHSAGLSLLDGRIPTPRRRCPAAAPPDGRRRRSRGNWKRSNAGAQRRGSRFDGAINLNIWGNICTPELFTFLLIFRLDSCYNVSYF